MTPTPTPTMATAMLALQGRLVGAIEDRPNSYFPEDDSNDDYRHRGRVPRSGAESGSIVSHRSRAPSVDDYYRKASDHHRHSQHGERPGNRRRASSTPPTPSASHGGRSSHRREDHGHDRGHSRERRHDRDRSPSRDRHHYPPSSSRSKSLHHPPPSRSGSKSGRKRAPSHPPERRSSSDVFMNAARIGFEAGAMAALKLRNDDSPWIGAKGAKIGAAALSAAAVDTFMEQKYPGHKGGLRHTMMQKATQIAIGNLVMKPVMSKGGGKR
ncbi:hypothetical protein B0H67DRAFT_553552 [Lasiosphaeris hirsuta]|uniref:Uncharacterized protein n=1 Tax=Lasiosphaeris hirsuta TaxID=260670 RepID=A0AA40AFK0_9PEZI|nr:hypothetical protein B0H67DRAFT_553552 [Lasiosphaeris hirsuta]